MTNQLPKINPGYQGKSEFILRLLLLGLAYFASGRLGLAIPYVGSHITLVWLAAGVAVAALMRWGYTCWPGIFLGALITNFSIDSSPLLDFTIAAGNTLAPLLAAWLLRRLNFQISFGRAYDILVFVAAAATGMLASASCGIMSLLAFHVMSVQDAVTSWLSWWAGDFVGVLLAAPLLLNISRAELKELWARRMEFLAWLSTMLALGWGVFFINNDGHGNSMPLVFLLLPVTVWSAIRFGIVGSSLSVLVPTGIATVATGVGLGPFYNADARQGLFLLWLYLATLALVNLMVAALQVARNRTEEKVRLDNDFNKELIQSLPGVFYMLDESGRFLMWNRQLESVLHCSSEEIAGSHPLDFFEGSDRALIEENIRKVFATGDTEVEAVLVAKDGVKTAYYFTGRRIERDGKQALVGMGIDITERRNAERAIREAKERSEVIFNTSPLAVLISRVSDGYITDTNDAFTRLTGYTREAVVGNTTLAIQLWVKAEDRERYVRELNEKGYCEDFEAQFRRSDGSLFFCSMSAGITTIHGVQHIVGVAHDITETKRIQKQTEALLSRYQTLMRTALDGIRVMDINGNVVEANDAFCEMLGYTHEEALKLNITDWDAQWTKEELLARLRGFIGKSGARFETVQRRKDGTFITVEVSTTGVEVDGQAYLFASSRDVTERKKVEQELRNSERKLRMLMDNAADAVFVADPRTERWLYVNERFKTLLGYSEEELLAGNIYDLVTPSYRDIYRERFQSIVNSGRVSTREMQLNRKDGSRVPLEMNAVTLPDGTVYGSCRDITERRKNEEAQRIAAVTFDTQEAIMITRPDATIMRVNQAFQDITGYSASEVVGQNPRMLQSGRHDAAFYQDMWSVLLDTGKWSGELWDRRKNGEIYPKLMTITAVSDDSQQLTHYVAVFRDISNRKKSEEEIHQLAFYDSLTQLPNRRLLLDRLQQAQAVSTRNGRHGALLFLDLDHFKTINDTQGHAMGDQLLIEVAHRLQTCVREGDSVVRLGGDEFVVVLEELSIDADEAAAQTELVAEKIRYELDRPYVLNDFECLSSVSIGVTLFLEHKESAEELLQHADVAMYQAKAAGRNTIRFFDPHMQTVLEARASMEADLHRALDKQQFRLHYQIQVDSLCRPLGAEVLLRWEHPEQGLVSPLQFIPLAEETGLIVPIGLWVLKTACTQLKEWQNNALSRELTLAVNVSAKQFRQSDFVAQVQRVLLESGAKPSHLKLELTESTVLENVEDTINKMRELKLLGVSFSLDDFGTGYSSLQYLKRLPLDQIKIDQTFVRDIVNDSNDAAIVQTIIAMTEALGLQVIAEGVEVEAQRAFLDDHGCHAFQGFLFSKPIPLDQFEALLRLKQKSL